MSITWSHHDIDIYFPQGALEGIDTRFRIDTTNDCAVLDEFKLHNLNVDRKRAVLLMGEDEVIAAEAIAWESWCEDQAHWGTAYDNARMAAE